VGYVAEPFDFAVGYRLLEGGASNDSVFTFACLHSLFGALGVRF